MRIKDGAQSEGRTTKNPADILACGEEMNFLIEAKEQSITTAKSFRFDRVKPHQRAALVRFSQIGQRHVGYVVILFYNGKLGKARIYRAWAIEARHWQTIAKKAKRGRIIKRKTKSMPMEWLTDGTVDAMELIWEPGTGFNILASLQRYVNGRL
jgi:penicillin-binding protein-related factor A (putative recombinase)